MLPQIGMTELLLIGAIALIVVGPKDLPLLLRRIGKFVGQAKRMARDFQSSFDELGRQAELEELRKEVEALKRDTTADLEKDLAKTNRELSDAMRDTSFTRTPPAGENRIAPPASSSAAAVHPAAPVKPAGPRIETPAVQARPRPDAAEAPAPPPVVAKTDHSA